MTRVKTASEISAMREGGAILGRILRLLAGRLEAGMTTRDLDRMAATELRALGGKPAFLGYQGFPAVLCVSVNNEVVHGIPGSRVLESGDIVGLDFGVAIEQMITDGAVTVAVGQPSAEAARLLSATEEALSSGIEEVRAGVRVGDISARIESRLRRDGLGIIEELSGHGVGHQLHEDPLILNYGRPGRGAVLKAGMTIAIEPMATLGGKDIVLAKDGWTIVTSDGSLGAQFEHTVLVTEEGSEILTLGI